MNNDATTAKRVKSQNNIDAILYVWDRQPKQAQYFFVCTKDWSQPEKKGWQEHPVIPRGEMRERLGAFVAKHADVDIYVCAHGFEKVGGKVKRTAEYAVPPNCLYADLDQADPRKLDVALRPTIAFETSPGRFSAVWLLDKPIDDEFDFNKRMSRYAKADSGGWMPTKVLRLIPGLPNRKPEYDGARVSLLWDRSESEPVRKLEMLSDVLPKLPATEATVKGAAAHLDEIYKAHHVIPLERKRIKSKPYKGEDRSVSMAGMYLMLRDKCVSVDDIFEIMRTDGAHWYQGRGMTEEGLRADIERVLDKKVVASQAGAPRKPADEEYTYLAKRGSEITPEKIDWVWFPYLARNELTIMDGDPSKGKSYLSTEITRHILDGLQLRYQGTPRDAVKGVVCHFDPENRASTVTIPRLRDNGVTEAGLDNFFSERMAFSIHDTAEMDKIYERLGQVKPTLVIFDVANHFTGRSNTKEGSEMTQAMQKFRDIAEAFNCSVLVLRHLNKTGGGPAMYRGQGTMSTLGLARVGLFVGPYDGDDSRYPAADNWRALAMTKGNNTKEKHLRVGLTFRVTDHPDDPESEDRSIFEWGNFVEDANADALAGAEAKDEKDLSEKQKAEAFLADVLSEGPVEAARVTAMAGERSKDFSDRTWRRVVSDWTKAGRLVSEPIPKHTNHKVRQYRLLSRPPLAPSEKDQKCQIWLREQLVTGAKKLSDLLAAAKKLDWSEFHLMRAAALFGVRKGNDGLWELPT